MGQMQMAKVIRLSAMISKVQKLSHLTILKYSKISNPFKERSTRKAEKLSKLLVSRPNDFHGSWSIFLVDRLNKIFDWPNGFCEAG